MGVLLVRCRDSLVSSHKHRIRGRTGRLCRMLPTSLMVLEQARAVWIIQLQEPPVLAQDLRQIPIKVPIIAILGRFKRLVTDDFSDGAAEVFLRVVQFFPARRPLRLAEQLSDLAAIDCVVPSIGW